MSKGTEIIFVQRDIQITISTRIRALYIESLDDYWIPISWRFLQNVHMFKLTCLHSNSNQIYEQKTRLRSLNTRR